MLVILKTQRSCKSQSCTDFQTIREGELNCDPSFWCCRRHPLSGGGCWVPSVLLSDQCLSGHRDRKAQPSPTPSAGYLRKCHTAGIYHPRDSSKQTCLCALSHTQTSCPCVRPKWEQLYAIKSVITAWINTSQYLLFPKVVNKPVIYSQAWGFIRAWA